MLLNNPILTSALKVRMRTWRGALGLTGYLGALALVTGLYFAARLIVPEDAVFTPSDMLSIGQTGYLCFAIVQFLLLVLLVPAQTGAAIAQERERQTIDLLLCTRMRPISIVLGKYAAAMSYSLLLLAVSMPFYALMMLFGGIGLWEMLGLFGYLLAIALGMGAIGILCSTLCKRTVTAIVASYAMVFLLGIGLFAATTVHTAWMGQRFQKEMEAYSIALQALATPAPGMSGNQPAATAAATPAMTLAPTAQADVAAVVQGADGSADDGAVEADGEAADPNAPVMPEPPGTSYFAYVSPVTGFAELVSKQMEGGNGMSMMQSMSYRYAMGSILSLMLSTGSYSSVYYGSMAVDQGIATYWTCAGTWIILSVGMLWLSASRLKRKR